MRNEEACLLQAGNLFILRPLKFKDSFTSFGMTTFWATSLSFSFILNQPKDWNDKTPLYS
ncbi:MAG TPA: hypothetical protein VK982_14520 [Bacteroidales bacterium]|nr:hypothetical protein [Bacteroidales bacterium]